MKYLVIWLLTCFFVLSLSCSKETTQSNEIIITEDILVKNNEITGWVYGGEKWNANNISELTTYINGIAELYQRYGFVDAAHQSYDGKINNGDHTLRLTVFKLQSEEKTNGVYEDPDLGMGSALNWENGAGKAAKYARYGGLSQVMIFYRGAYFLFMQIDQDTEESLSILKQFALNVDNKIK